MTDIIQRAKDLIEEATPGPWEWSGYDLESTRNTVIEFECVTGFRISGATRHVEITPEDETLIAAAPELAQTLAEETYEYGVTYIGVNHGGQYIEWVESTGDAEWDKDSLQLLVKRWKRREQSPKVVRRRVSPPEVINE